MNHFLVFLIVSKFKRNYIQYAIKYSFNLATRIDLEGLVVFTRNNNFYQVHLSTPDQIQKTVITPDVFKQTEVQVRIWAKQIEMVSIL